MNLPSHILNNMRFAVGLALALLLWEGVAAVLQGTYLFAGPLAVIAYFFENAALLGRALNATLKSAALGYLWGNLAAVFLATCALLVPLTERPIRVLSLIIFCLPLIATGPILRVLYGPGSGPEVTLAALGVFYTTLVPLLAGLRATPRVWLDLVDSYGRGRWTALTQVRALAAIPYLIAGLQIAAPAAFLGAMIGEFTGAEKGLGVLTLRAMRSLDVDATWAIATLAAIASVLAYALAGKIGRWLWPGASPILLVPPPDARPGARYTSVFMSLALIPAVLFLWHGSMAAFGLNRFFAKRPDDIWTYLVSGPDAIAHRETLMGALRDTLMTAGPGYFAGLVTGAALAILCILLPRLSAAVLPVAVILRAVPIVITAPLIVLWLGRGTTGIVTIVAVMIFFPTLIACLHGLRLAPKPVIDMFESYAAGAWQTLLHARIPAALPAFFAAARMAVPAALLAATVAEWLATGQGIGNLMALSSSTSNYSMLWSAIVALTVVAIVTHAIVAWIETAVFLRYAPEQMHA